jgi:hypothetical protein
VAHAAPAPTLSQAQVFGVHPVQQGQTTLPGGHFNFALKPGDRISDGMVVENFSDHPIDFHLYGADLLTVPGGGVAPAQPTDTMREAGTWLAFARTQVTIPAHSHATQAFSVALPAAVDPGEHLGAAVAAAVVGRSPQGSAIEARTALVVVITVPGIASPSASLGALGRADNEPGPIEFQVALTNTGNLLLTYAGTVDVFDRAGRKLASLPLTPGDAYVVPAGQVALSAAWKDSLPTSGDYTAVATVTILASGKPVATLTSSSLALSFSHQPSTVVGAAIIAIVVLLLAAAALLARRVRRGRRARTAAILLRLSQQARRSL